VLRLSLARLSLAGALLTKAVLVQVLRPRQSEGACVRGRPQRHKWQGDGEHGHVCIAVAGIGLARPRHIAVRADATPRQRRAAGQTTVQGR
jgi:hypothetical protein